MHGAFYLGDESNTAITRKNVSIRFKLVIRNQIYDMSMYAAYDSDLYMYEPFYYGDENLDTITEKRVLYS
jgi:hypothetical protein